MFLQETDLNVVPGGIIPVMHVSQYDVGRELKFVLYSGYDYASLESGTTVTIEGTKPDGHGFQYSGVLDQNAHTATFVTTEQMTVLAGAIECKLTLYLNSQRIGTALFILDVEKAGINDSTIISDTELPLIIAQATEQMERAEAAAIAAALSEENAEAEALKAEGYATGKQNGEEVSSESPYYHNNAEYYSEYAESIADRLPEGLSPKGTCVFADLPSISESIVGDMWVISDSFITTSDFRGGSGVSVAAGAYVYLTDSNKWDILPSKSGGHMIVDSEGVTMPQRAKLKFVGCTVTDDSEHDTTLVEAEGGGSSVVASLAITTNNSAFYGQTVTVKDSNGDTVNTGVFSNSGTVSIGVVGANYYTAIVTAYGATVSQQVAVTESGSYNVALNSDTILGAWINKGGLDYTDYADFAAVEADEEAIRRLMTIHASVDYLAECGSATDSLVLSIINSDICAKWINLRDYALDTLYANTYIASMMDTADKYFYGEWVITDSTTTPPTWGAKGNVPVMTTASAPYGTAFGSNEDISSAYSKPYMAFDGDDSTLWSIDASHKTNIYVGYIFNSPIRVNRIYYKTRTLTALSARLEGSNDTTTGQDGTWADLGAITSPTGGYIDISNVNYYKAYRFYIVSETTQAGNQYGGRIETLQFYGRELRESVPVMTSNTAPYGVASAESQESSSYAPWKAFAESRWDSSTVSGYSTPTWISYEFTYPVIIKRCSFNIYQVNRKNQTANIIIQASSDGTTWVDISESQQTTTSNVQEDKVFDCTPTQSYRYYRIYFSNRFIYSSSDSSKYYASARDVKLFGLNYTEYDWDTDHPRHYLYDHGVELETITTGGTMGSSAITLSAANQQATATLDTTDYTALGGKVGSHASGTNQLICGASTSNFSASNMPSGNGIDISSVNGSNATGVKQTAQGTFDIEEVWIA